MRSPERACARARVHPPPRNIRGPFLSTNTAAFSISRDSAPRRSRRHRPFRVISQIGLPGACGRDRSPATSQSPTNPPAGSGSAGAYGELRQLRARADEDLARSARWSPLSARSLPGRGDDAATAIRHARSTRKRESVGRINDAITNVRDHLRWPGRYHAACGIRRLRSQRGPRHDDATSRAARSGSPPGTPATDHRPQTREGMDGRRTGRPER
jgi:hypothetical protein